MARTKIEKVVPAGTENFNPAEHKPEASEDFQPLSASKGPNPYKGWVQLDKPMRIVVPGKTEPLQANVHVNDVLTGIRRDAREHGWGLRERLTATEDNSTLIQWQGYRKSEKRGRRPSNSDAAPTAQPAEKAAAPRPAAKAAAVKR